MHTHHTYKSKNTYLHTPAFTKAANIDLPVQYRSVESSPWIKNPSRDPKYTKYGAYLQILCRDKAIPPISPKLRPHVWTFSHVYKLPLVIRMKTRMACQKWDRLGGMILEITSLWILSPHNQCSVIFTSHAPVSKWPFTIAWRHQKHAIPNRTQDENSHV